MKILVTGVGGDIGNSIGRILKTSNSTSRLLGCDINGQSNWGSTFDELLIVPRADSLGYLTELMRLVEAFNIDVIIPTSEPELRRLFLEGIDTHFFGAKMIMANREALSVGFDKLATAEFLKANGLPFPWTLPVDGGEPISFPCIMKNRFGAGGNDVRVVTANDSTNALRSVFGADFIWQEHIGSPDDEYTCGVYRGENGSTRIIAFKRKLSAGVTAYAEVVKNDAIEKLCTDIAEAIKLNGAINVQLRFRGNQPVVFEINPRFSSTVMFRHVLGFTDVLWALSERVFSSLPTYVNTPKIGTRVVRNFGETVLP